LSLTRSQRVQNWDSATHLVVPDQITEDLDGPKVPGLCLVSGVVGAHVADGYRCQVLELVVWQDSGCRDFRLEDAGFQWWMSPPSRRAPQTLNHETYNRLTWLPERRDKKRNHPHREELILELNVVPHAQLPDAAAALGPNRRVAARFRV
jgi:hypothetical protein